MARCPLVHVNSRECPQGFERIEQEWLRHQREAPTDPEIARRLALFIAEREHDRARGILGEAQRANPSPTRTVTV
jgi:hypothetical protein